MKIYADLHCHTVNSGHAYSTIKEYADEASKKGLKVIAITDHGPAMPGGPHIFHIGNQRVLPKYISDVRILKGVEANILDYKGSIDLPERYMKNLDIVVASLHDICIAPGNVEENTNAMIGAMKNPFINIIAHPGNPYYPIDVDKVVQCAKETDTLLEINNGTFVGSRKGSFENCKAIAQKAKEKGVVVSLGSDAHTSYDIGRIDMLMRVLEESGMPEELIINTSIERLIFWLNRNGRNIEYKSIASYV